MKIALVYPFYGTGKRSRYFPFGLAYIASVLRESGHEIHIVDMEGDDLTVQQAVARLVDLSPDVIGFGGMVTRYRLVKDIAHEVRSLLPGVFMIAGNSGATTVPELYLRNCNLNAVVLGEGENTTLELCRSLEEKQDWTEVPGLAYLNNEGIFRTSSPRQLIENLDSIPLPAWDLFPIENYIASYDHRQKSVRHLEVVASRGCPFNCVYCYRIYGRTVRRRSPESIVSEIEILRNEYHIEYTGFPDDLFTSNREFVMETCRLLKERVSGINWSCLGRVNTVDREMLQAMKDAGCDWISYGIESGDDEMLARMNRGVTADECLNAMNLTRSVGIHAEGSFMIGMFGETRESVANTVDFCRKADITAPMLFVTPYPGTAIFNRAVEENRIDNVEDFLEKMNAADELLINLTDIPDNDLFALRDWAQGTIGKNFLLRKPLTRIPALLFRHFVLKGFRGLLNDIREYRAARRRDKSV